MKKSLSLLVGGILLTMPLVSLAQINSALSYGSHGAQVTELQEFLISLGDLTGQATGNFYSLTLAAVKEYQSANNIPSTGYVGVLTRTAINTSLSSELASSTSEEVQETGTTTIFDPKSTPVVSELQQQNTLLQQQLSAQQQTNQLLQNEQPVQTPAPTIATAPAPDCTPSPLLLLNDTILQINGFPYVQFESDYSTGCPIDPSTKWSFTGGGINANGDFNEGGSYLYVSYDNGGGVGNRGTDIMHIIHLTSQQVQLENPITATITVGGLSRSVTVNPPAPPANPNLQSDEAAFNQELSEVSSSCPQSEVECQTSSSILAVDAQIEVNDGISSGDAQNQVSQITPTIQKLILVQGGALSSGLASVGQGIASQFSAPINSLQNVISLLTN